MTSFVHQKEDKQIFFFFHLANRAPRPEINKKANETNALLLYEYNLL